MKKAKVYSAEVNGIFTQLKAYKKINAITRFKQLNPDIKASNVRKINAVNPQQTPIEDIYNF